MKILYGIQATGNGHIARARVMARAFARRGVEVDYLLSGRDRAQLFGVEPFGDYQLKKGLTFDVKAGRVRYLATALQLPLVTLARDITSLDIRRYDLVISDFEPVSAWAARLRGTNSIGISHQCAFRYPIPTEGGNLVARQVMRSFAPVKYCLGMHWDSFGFPIIPPMIDLDDSLATDSRVIQNRILVYLPFEAPSEIKRFLEPFPDHHFIVYAGLDPSNSRGNIIFRNFAKASFHADLNSCSGVVCNAGFELPSECIHLGKRLLVKPVYGQMEQLSNARALTELGLGYRLSQLDSQALGKWLSTPSPAPHPFGDVAGRVVDWILQGDLQDMATLSGNLWSDVRAITGKRETYPAGEH
jgi:uncharacterized protein (TIGR00661 family)